MTVAILYRNDKHKEFVKRCNSFRCPLCGSQLDGNIHSQRADLYCVQDNSEYCIVVRPDSDSIHSEKLMFSYSQYGYQIFIDEHGTWVYRVNMDDHPSKRFGLKKKIFHIPQRITGFHKRMNEEEFLQKLQTYQLFS